MQAMRKVAMKLAGVEEGVACAGTPLESRTTKVGGKAFLFLRASEARLKLMASLAAAKALAKKSPARVRVGSGGWVKILLDDADPLPMNVIAKWIAESHALMLDA